MKRLRTLLAALAAVLLVLAAAVVVLRDASPTANSASPGTPDPTRPGDAVTGALFNVDDRGNLLNHFCSASVVHSPAGDLVMTAAHCLYDHVQRQYATGIAFVPGYHDGIAPYGSWTPTRTFVDPRWVASEDPDLDFAFLVVHQPGSPRSIEETTGANRVGMDVGFTNQVDMTGYPLDADRPVSCHGTSTQADTHQAELACLGFPDGTSGGPWVTHRDPRTHLGTVVGVIDEYPLGGSDPDVSYTASFGADFASLYRAACAAG